MFSSERGTKDFCILGQSAVEKVFGERKMKMLSNVGSFVCSISINIFIMIRITDFI